MCDRGVLIVLSGFSGTGKGTLVKEVLRQHPQEYALSVSATTRAPRAGEEHGREYFFFSESQFRDMIAQDELLEYACYVEHYYGTPRRYVEQQLSQGRHVILEIECQGAMQIREKMPQAVLIFLLPPSVDELRRRLYGRGTEDDAAILKRLMQAGEELNYLPQFDYVVVNDILSDAVRDFDGIVRAQTHRTAANAERICVLREEMAGIVRREADFG